MRVAGVNIKRKSQVSSQILSVLSIKCSGFIYVLYTVSPTVVLKKSSMRNDFEKYLYQQAIGQGKFLVLGHG